MPSGMEGVDSLGEDTSSSIGDSGASSIHHSRGSFLVPLCRQGGRSMDNCDMMWQMMNLVKFAREGVEAYLPRGQVGWG